MERKPCGGICPVPFNLKHLIPLVILNKIFSPHDGYIFSENKSNLPFLDHTSTPRVVTYSYGNRVVNNVTPLNSNIF